MPRFRRGDIVKVPFPYTDRATRQRRPALVVASTAVDDWNEIIWVLMITSAENRGWPGDIAIADHHAAGLPAPSVIRTAKIASIDARDAGPLGRAAAATIEAATARVTLAVSGD